MGEELELGNLFVVCDDGTYVPFEEIKPVDIRNCDNEDAVYARWPNCDEPISFELDMRRRDYRKAMKMFKAQEGATSHSFRASYATMMNTHCDHMDPKVLQGVLRHKTPDLALKVYTKENSNKTKVAEIEYDN